MNPYPGMLGVCPTAEWRLGFYCYLFGAPVSFPGRGCADRSGRWPEFMYTPLSTRRSRPARSGPSGYWVLTVVEISAIFCRRELVVSIRVPRPHGMAPEQMADLLAGTSGPCV